MYIDLLTICEAKNVEYVLISVETKKAEARKKHAREWPEAVNGENSGDQANVSVKNTW